MSEYGKISDIELHRNPIRCAWNDEVFTIIKTVGRENRTIVLTPDEEDYLYEQLRLKRKPWNDAS